MAPPLSSFERGFVVAAVRALGARAASFLRARGEHLAAGATAIASATFIAPEGRGSPVGNGDDVGLAREIERLDAVPLAGIERVHPSWWQRPPQSSRLAARAFLERAATAHLVAMPAHRESSRASLETLDALPSEALASLVQALGRRRVAVAFSDAPRESLAQLCMRVGEPAASEILAAVKTIEPAHDEVRAAQRALFKLAVEATDARSLFVSAGLRWLAPALASLGGDHLRRVAQRLPMGLGTQLVAEAGATATSEDHRHCAAALAELAR